MGRSYTFGLFSARTHGCSHSGNFARSEIPECFRVYQSGYRHEDRLVRDSLTANDLRDCEVACEDANFFDCRSFSFTSDRTITRNCDLSPADPRDLSMRDDLIEDRDYDVYDRRSCDDYYGGGGGEDRTSKGPV